MISIIVSVLMWMLVASLLVLRRGRVERSITYAALIIAVSMTLNIDALYEAMDGLVGGTNIVTLVADLALMTGVFFLGRAVMRAENRTPRLVKIALGRTVYFVAVLGATAAFLLIDRGSTTTNFMLDLGSQPAAAAYSMTHFTYYAVVLSAMTAVAAQQAGASHGIESLPSFLLVAGSALGVGLAADVVLMDVAHVAGDLSLMAAAASAYFPLYLATFVLLCLGFAGQPASRAIQRRRRAQTTRMLTRQLAPTWRAASKVRPGISQNEEAAFDAEDPETLLHRQVVEVRDAMIDTRVEFTLAEAEREVLERAERHLVREAAPSAASSRIRA